MSSISDTEMADVSPPRPAVKSPPVPLDTDAAATADSNDDGRRSNSSPTRHIPLPEESSSSLQAAGSGLMIMGGGGSTAAGVSSNTPPMGEAISSPEQLGSVSNKEDKGGLFIVFLKDNKETKSSGVGSWVNLNSAHSGSCSCQKKGRLLPAPALAPTIIFVNIY